MIARRRGLHLTSAPLHLCTSARQARPARLDRAARPPADADWPGPPARRAARLRRVRVRVRVSPSPNPNPNPNPNQDTAGTVGTAGTVIAAAIGTAASLTLYGDRYGDR